jgi:hypothetical protein
METWSQETHTGLLKFLAEYDAVTVGNWWIWRSSDSREWRPPCRTWPKSTLWSAYTTWENKRFVMLTGFFAEDLSFVRYYTLSSGEQLPSFRKSVLPSSSRSISRISWTDCSWRWTRGWRHYSETLRGVDWYLVAHVSGQPTGHILNGQGVPNCVTLEDGTHRFFLKRR